MTDDNELALDKSPSPEEEAEDFSTVDEKADTRAKNHELELLRTQMGPIGRLIGSSNSSETIAAFTVFISLAFMAAVFFMAFDAETGILADGAWKLLSLLASIVTGSIGFIFGSRQR